MKVERPCGFRGKCNTLTTIENPTDLESIGMYQAKWCDEHMNQYKREQKILDKLVPKYNKMKLKNKFGEVIKFSHGTDVSNYLFRNNKRELNKILRSVQK